LDAESPLLLAVMRVPAGPRKLRRKIRPTSVLLAGDAGQGQGRGSQPGGDGGEAASSGHERRPYGLGTARATRTRPPTPTR